jgi:hypothetical protein
VTRCDCCSVVSLFALHSLLSKTEVWRNDRLEDKNVFETQRM